MAQHQIHLAGAQLSARARQALRFTWLSSFYNACLEYLLGESHSYVPWMVVSFAVGIGYYFCLPSEPNLVLTSAVAIGLCVLAALAHKHSQIVFVFVLPIFFFAFGLAAVGWRTEMVHAPRLTEPVKDARIYGIVERLYPADKRHARLIVKVKRIYSNTKVKATKLQVTSSNFNPDVKVGDLIAFSASISPNSRPQFPNGYDFARHAYFNQVGGTAFSVSKIKIVESEPAKAKSFWFKIERLRLRIFEMLESRMGKINGGVAAALIIGEQKSISKQVMDDMRNSGLSHVLSVSGLHLSLVSIICIVAIRRLLSCSLYIAQRFNTKKIAASVSLLVALSYLLISGVQVAAVRSFIMAAIIMLGILLDRQDNAKRSLFIAAFLILLINPESVFQPSFQMSFSAVLALVASYEFFYKKPDDSGATSDRSLFSRATVYLLGTLFTSLIASLATSIFVIYHFHNYSNYAMLSNLLAGPVVSFVIMPSIILTFFLMPIGLHWIGLYALNFGITCMLRIAKYVSDLTLANVILPPTPGDILPLFSIGLLWVCIWEKRWRWLGLAPIAASFAIILLSPFPKIIVDARYNTVIAKIDAGKLVRVGGPGRISKSHKAQWLALMNGQKLETIKVGKTHTTSEQFEPRHLLKGPGYTAEVELGERTTASGKLALARPLPIFSRVTVSAAGRSISLDQADLARCGTHFVYPSADGIRTQCSETKSSRPWDF